MKRIFPEMNDRPGNWMPVPAVAYWIFAFFVLPTWLPMIADGLTDNLAGSSWVDIALHIINALVVSISLHRREELAAHFKRLEGIWNAHSVYIDKENE